MFRAIAAHLMMTLMLAALLGGCGDSDAPATARSPADGLTGKLTLTGSSTLAPLAAEIGKRFEQRHPGVRVDVQTGGSSRGIRDVTSGAADVGMSSRSLNADETPGLTTHTVAWDGVCFIVHRDNPVAALTNEQLLAIYTGKIDNWKQVDGDDAPIVVIDRAEGRSEVELVTHFFRITTPDIKADAIAGENQQAIKSVSTNPNAIVYLSIGTSEHEAARGVPIKLLPLNGVPASVATVLDGTFPLARPLIMITRNDTPSPLVDAFIAFATSSDVDDLVEAQSFVPIKH
ncbi:MAG: phosphate ABC transporter substrate-binding protein [Phycisphaera sp.]|nr:phosphate ABC transporter substrate-binding protein [Phycisphaera sp.]